MSIEPFGRRELFAGTGGVFLCTLAGQKVFADKGEADLGKLSEELTIPPKVLARADKVSRRPCRRAGHHRRSKALQCHLIDLVRASKTAAFSVSNLLVPYR